METGVILYLLVCTLVMVGVTFWLLAEFAHESVTADVKAVVWLSWNLSLVVVFVVPLDLRPSVEDDASLSGFYLFVYWTSFILTWLWLPLVQGYKASGAFTAKEKALDSLKLNALFYGICATLLVLGFIYLLLATDVKPSTLLALTQSLGNIWGLCMGVLTMGYGLVEIPRRMFYKSDLKARASYYNWKLFSTQHDLEEASDRLNECLYLWGYLSDSASHGDRYATVLAAEMEMVRMAAATLNVDLTQRVAVSQLDSHTIDKRQEVVDAIDSGEFSLKELAFIKAELKTWAFERQRAQALWDYYAKQAIVIETLLADDRAADGTGMGAGSRDGVGLMPLHSPPLTASAKGGFVGMGNDTNNNGICVQFEKKYKPLFFKSLSIALALLSLLVVWSELTLSFDAKLSVFAAVSNNGKRRSFGVVFFGFVALTYICVCALYALWQLRFGLMYQMHARRLTHGDSLLANAAFSLRLTFPLAYNFFLMSKAKGQSDYSAMFKNMNELPVLGTPVNSLLPMLVIVFCLSTWFNVYGRLLKFLRLSRFEYSEATGARHSEEVAHQIRSGQQLLNKFKTKLRTDTAFRSQFEAQFADSWTSQSIVSKVLRLFTGERDRSGGRSLVPDSDDIRHMDLESIDL